MMSPSELRSFPSLSHVFLLPIKWIVNNKTVPTESRPAYSDVGRNSNFSQTIVSPMSDVPMVTTEG
jgi:hypothetical protein